MTGLIAVRSPGGRAQSGCGSGLAAATKTPGGLPHESGEASGLVTSTRYPGWAWMIRDSSHPASLYALKVSPVSYAAAVTAASAVIGPVIPPSIPMVLYALVSDASVGCLFLGRVVPGLFMALAR